MFLSGIVQNLVGHSFVRWTANRALDYYARFRLQQLDRCPVAQVQHDTLMRLVYHARHTRFGQEHYFSKIGTLTAYQDWVPLRTYEDFWTDYWQPAFPRIKDVTWPGLIPYFALSSGTTTGTTKYIPVSRAMLRSNRRAALTTLAHYAFSYLDSRIAQGRIFFLGGSSELQQLALGVHAGDLSGIVTREVPAVMRPYSFPSLDLALLRDWEVKIQRLAELSVGLPITVISGVPSWLLLLFERLMQVTGRSSIADIWPTLRLVIHGGTKFDPYRSLFRRLISSDRVRLLETYPASEGFIAIEDPRHDLLRLVPDHQIFFEFVPVEELGKDRPVRHTVADVEPGVQYAVVLTTCAGLWSYVIGDTVCFERRDPPLLRFTGRTRYFLSAFGEHLISEEIEKAVTLAAEATAAEVVDFHVGPIFPEQLGDPGRHLYLMEFDRLPTDLHRFPAELDAALGRLNEDYAAHRAGDLTMRAPEVRYVRRGGFAEWMKSRGKLGGQNKLPRMDNSGLVTAEMAHWLSERGYLDQAFCISPKASFTNGSLQVSLTAPSGG